MEQHIETPKHLYILMEKMEGGTLGQLLETYKEANKRFNDIEASTLIRSLLQAVNYIHGFDIIHRDIKPGKRCFYFCFNDVDNILLKDKADLASLKLSDFGLCNDKHYDLLFEGEVGTPIYMAPEQTLKQYYCKAVDIWAVGIIMYMVIAGKHPLFEQSDTKATYKQKLQAPVWVYGRDFSK